jgi:hypothetical protein
MQGVHRADKLHCGQNRGCTADRIEDAIAQVGRKQDAHFTLHGQDTGCRMHTHRVHPAQHMIEKGNPYMYSVASSMMVLTGYFMTPRKEGKETKPVTQF